MPEQPLTIAVDLDSYYVCERCGHFWSQPFDPDRCENCHHAWLGVHDTLEAAEDASEDVLEGRRARLMPMPSSATERRHELASERGEGEWE